MNSVDSKLWAPVADAMSELQLRATQGRQSRSLLQMVKETLQGVVGRGTDHADLRGLLARNERDLDALRDSLKTAETELSDRRDQLSHLERHAAALDAEVARLRDQALRRGEETGELRARLSDALLAQETFQLSWETERRDAALLRRRVAELAPKAQSNTAGLSALNQLWAECERLRGELHAVRASTSWRATAPVRRVTTLIRSAVSRARRGE